MKNKKCLFIIIIALVILFITATAFFTVQGLLAANKNQKYFDVYRTKAKEYIKSNTEILDIYGNDISVTFDDSFTYLPSGETGPFDRYIEVFAPRSPDTLEEFNKGVDMIEFRIKINGNPYVITFEKGNDNELSVSHLTED